MSWSQWFDKKCGSFYNMYTETLLPLDTSAPAKMVKKLAISHRDTSLDLLASRTIRIGDIVEYYYVSLLYAYRSKEQHETKVYGEGLLKVTAEMFRKW